MDIYIQCFRLLMEYHSFLFDKETLLKLVEICDGFRLLMEYHSFLCKLKDLTLRRLNICFRLLMEYHSFLLIIFLKCLFLHWWVTRFRLLMEYHSFLLKQRWLTKAWKNGHLVSVSLWSIIHSYSKKQIIIDPIGLLQSFRLLMEYHSFLYKDIEN